MTSSDLEIGSLTAWGLESGSWLGLANLLLSAGFFPDLHTGRKKSQPESLLVANIVNDKVVYIFGYLL